MLITDTLDGRLMARLLRQVSDRRDTLRYRRKVGWFVAPCPMESRSTASRRIFSRGWNQATRC
jgi:hypothetical protein